MGRKRVRLTQYVGFRSASYLDYLPLIININFTFFQPINAFTIIKFKNTVKSESNAIGRKLLRLTHVGLRSANYSDYWYRKLTVYLFRI